MESKSTLAISHNVKRLMEHRGGMSQRDLAKAAGISQSAVGYLLRYRDDTDRHPTTATIEAVAHVFGLEAWQMMIPDLPIELLQSPRLVKLLENYTAAPDEGRRVVERVAEGEVRYSIAETIMTDKSKEASAKKAG